MPLIRHWFPSDEEQNGALGVAITDEDGGFVAGVMNCFAGLALAGVLAANALAAQLPYAVDYQGDELAPAVFVVESLEWPVVFTPATTPGPVRAVTDDDQYVGYLGIDDDGWLPPIPPTPCVTIGAFSDDSDVALTTPGIAVEHSDWMVFVPAALPLRTVAVTEQDEYAPALSFAGDEDAVLWPRVPAIVATFAAVVADDSGYPPPLGGLLARVSLRDQLSASVTLSPRLTGTANVTPVLAATVTVYPA